MFTEISRDFVETLDKESFTKANINTYISQNAFEEFAN